MEMMAAGGWQLEHRRIPAFGNWNDRRDDDAAAGIDDWSWQAAVTPCFDFASAAMRTTARPAAAQHKSSNNNNNKRSSMPNGRRMRIPAFGEWNHNGDGDEGGNGMGIGINGNGTWPAVMMTPFFDLAATPQKAPKTGRRRVDAELATAAEAPQQGHNKLQTTKRRSKVADSGAYAAMARRSCFTVAKPVDDDLYGVPPDMFYGNPTPGPRKEGWLKILRLMGCSCFRPS